VCHIRWTAEDAELRFKGGGGFGEARPFYRTISGVRLYWELEEPKGPRGSILALNAGVGGWVDEDEVKVPRFNFREQREEVQRLRDTTPDVISTHADATQPVVGTNADAIPRDVC